MLSLRDVNLLTLTVTVPSTVCSCISTMNIQWLLILNPIGMIYACLITISGVAQTPLIGFDPQKKFAPICFSVKSPTTSDMFSPLSFVRDFPIDFFYMSLLLESALQAMKLMGVDCGVFLETKLTKGVYTHWSSIYNIRSTHVPSKWHGGIHLFWRTSEAYEFKEVELRGPYVVLFQLILGARRWYIVGCYIPLNDLTTLKHIE